MRLRVVKRFVIITLILTFALFGRSQQTHFVYLQTENGQPFYVKINNKVVSSSSAGYIILPKLKDGDYKLNIGFPKKEFPEEDFQIVIDKKNEGFLLKNFGDKGWGLFNMQSYKVVMGGNTDAVAITPKNLQDDTFSRMLADVVKDSSILQKSEPVKEEEPVPAKVDSPVAIIEKAASLLLPATRFMSKKNNDGMEMIYIDNSQHLNDTIRIFIPSDKSMLKAGNVDQNTNPPVDLLTDTASIAVEQSVSQMKSDTGLFVAPEKKNMAENTDSIVSKKMDQVKQPGTNSKDREIKPGNAEIAKKDDIKKDDIVVLPQVIQSSTTNSDCRAFASNEDFLKIRKKMASGNSDDNMIKMAKKAFHSKCFSTEQVKNLSFLFLTNAGKYMFFDLAYPFASDSDQYYTLQSQLTDSYYINRFKAMIHK